MSTELSAKRTPVTPEQAAAYLAQAYRTVAAKPPTRSVLSLLVAQWALETANGRSMWRYNFGNKKYSSRDEHFQYLTGCFEYVQGVRETYGARHPSCKFAAYTSPQAGATAFVALLARRAHWWAGLHSGSSAGFVAGLTTRPAYFTSGADKYRAGLDSRAARFAAAVVQHSAPQSPMPWAVMGLAAAAGYWLVVRS